MAARDRLRSSARGCPRPYKRSESGGTSAKWCSHAAEPLSGARRAARPLPARGDGPRPPLPTARGGAAAGRTAWSASTTAVTAFQLGAALEHRTAHRRPRRDGGRARDHEATWIGHSFGGKLVAELAARHPDSSRAPPSRSRDAHRPRRRRRARRADVRRRLVRDPDEAIEARLADGSLFTTPRRCSSRRRGAPRECPDGRWRWQWSPPAVIVAWSEMATAAPPWPRARRSSSAASVRGSRSPPRNGNVTRGRRPGGHSVLWDDFDATADAIVRFLG